MSTLAWSIQMRDFLLWAAFHQTVVLCSATVQACIREKWLQQAADTRTQLAVQPVPLPRVAAVLATYARRIATSSVTTVLSTIDSCGDATVWRSQAMATMALAIAEFSENFGETFSKCLGNGIRNVLVTSHTANTCSVFQQLYSMFLLFYTYFFNIFFKHVQ